jgi:polyisoprenoid-binding protein YceI
MAARSDQSCSDPAPRRGAMTAAAPGVAVSAAALCLAACHGAPRIQSQTGAPPAVSAPAVSAPAVSAPSASAVRVRYRIDAERSEVLILVYRDGRLASLGHNHVVGVRQLSGEVIVAEDPAQSSWQLDFPAAALSVDDPQLRASQGEAFQSELDAAAIAGTREHMLGPLLLDAARYPLIHLQSAQARSEADGLHVSTRIVVRDHAVEMAVPVAVQRSPEELIASGDFDLTHAQLGLTPYSVALGALRVAERMQVHYRLVALRERDAAP